MEKKSKGQNKAEAKGPEEKKPFFYSNIGNGETIHAATQQEADEIAKEKMGA